MLLVTLEDVDVRLWGREILSGVSFALRAGESWALVGPNGCGKSTLLRLLRGEEQPHPGSPGRRLYHFLGPPQQSPIGARERLPLVSPERQEAYLRRDWDVRVERVVASGIDDSVWPAAAPGAEDRRRVAEALALFGLEGLAPRSVLSLSAGEARKVMLARALASRPVALLLDEPLDGLDAPSRSALLALLDRLAREGTAVVLATHRHDEIGPGFSRVARMEGGRIVALGPRGGMPARLAAPPPAARRRAAGPAAAPAREPLVSIERADVLVEGRPVLRDVTWRVRRGERWAVVGPNGAGKSTLLRLVVGDEQAAPGGRVARLGLGPRASVWEVKARVGLVTPDLQARHRADVRAEDVVLSGLRSSIGADGTPDDRERERTAACLARVGASHLARRRIHSLSYGEMRRLLVARALMAEPELLVLDEPASGLDPAARAALLDLLRSLCDGGLTLLFSTHHEPEARGLATHLLALEGGRVVRQGPVAPEPEPRTSP